MLPDVQRLQVALALVSLHCKVTLGIASVLGQPVVSTQRLCLEHQASVDLQALVSLQYHSVVDLQALVSLQHNLVSGMQALVSLRHKVMAGMQTLVSPHHKLMPGKASVLGQPLVSLERSLLRRGAQLGLQPLACHQQLPKEYLKVCHAVAAAVAAVAAAAAVGAHEVALQWEACVRQQPAVHV